MGKEAEMDFLWEVIMFVTDSFGYNCELVVSDKNRFRSFIMIKIPVQGRLMAYIKIDAQDVVNMEKKIGIKRTMEMLGGQIEYQIKKLRNRYGGQF